MEAILVDQVGEGDDFGSHTFGCFTIGYYKFLEIQNMLQKTLI